MSPERAGEAPSPAAFPTATWVGKVGGSLLEPPALADLGERIRAVVAERGGVRPLLVVGGGTVVDAIRSWDRDHSLGEEFCHWLAVDALGLSARALERLLGASAVVARGGDGLERAWRAGRLPILDCAWFLKEVDDRRPDPLPRRWRVTSDSIAARVTERFGARELALLKSAPAAPGLSRAEAVEMGLVDPSFAAASARIESVVCIDLRGRPSAAVPLRP